MSSVPERRPIIRGDRVFLRPSERDDLPLFVHWFNDADVLRNLAIYAGNDRARRSYEKAGFSHEGTLRRAQFARGEHLDVHVMSLLRDEWAALPHRRSWESD